LVWYGEEVVEKQLELNRIATLAIALYTSAAVLSRMNQEGVTKEGLLYLSLTEETMNHAISRLYRAKDKLYEPF
jgi:hypothetical protein